MIVDHFWDKIAYFKKSKKQRVSVNIKPKESDKIEKTDTFRTKRSLIMSGDDSAETVEQNEFECYSCRIGRAG